MYENLNARILMAVNNYLYFGCKDDYILEELLDELLKGRYDLDEPLKLIKSLEEAQKLLNGEIEYNEIGNE